eukprot:scaffold3159_cov393-Prasinococcus_capsulatus_cf.AAC.16
MVTKPEDALQLLGLGPVQVGCAEHNGTHWHQTHDAQHEGIIVRECDSVAQPRPKGGPLRGSEAVEIAHEVMEVVACANGPSARLLLPFGKVCPDAVP